ncbi:MAG: 6-phosphofructokinase, partial [Candidatus Omnitrophica bacterium]|nr:6-phosphofructokinase [Candidatus Omnitrophota bacterium]
WIALHTGLSSGGDIILIPEIPYDIEKVVERIKERNKKGKRFSIVVVAEGAKPKGGGVVVQRMVKDGSEPVRLGGISFVLGKDIEERTGIETRNVVMGHLQRGGSPTAFDRLLGTRLGAKAVDFIVDGDFGYMVGVKGDQLIKVPLTKVAQGSRLVEPGNPLIQMGISLGTCFGF